MNFNFTNTYSALDKKFFEKVEPTKVSSPSLIHINESLAKELKLDPEFLKSKDGIEILSGNKIAKGSEPIAQAYAGHQFGHFVPQLGDGRAILLGEVIDAHGQRKDIQLKGSGQTPFSRRGDGRAALGPVIREYIVSEAMHHLGIATTRSLAAVFTGEHVYRETALPGAILTRVASSHIRVGTFEYFSAKGDDHAIKTLTHYVLNRHYPDLLSSDNQYLALLQRVCEKQADLVSDWMSIGFIHGVMNTDNCSVSGETIDYGPCAFMDFYNPSTVFSSIDHQGRYAYVNQGYIGQWNMNAFAAALMPLIDLDQEKAARLAEPIINAYEKDFADKFKTKLLKKIGINEAREGDLDLIYGLLDLMKKYRADFTLSFRYLSDILLEQKEERFFNLFDSPDNDELKGWLIKWKVRLHQDQESIAKAMNQINPLFIPRNHRVEEALASAYKGDYSHMEILIGALSKPFEENDEYFYLSQPPENKDSDYVTFCGT